MHGKLTKWNWLVLHPERLTLGKNVDIGAFTLIEASGGITIEDDVQIGGGCMIYSRNTIDNTCGSVWIKRGARIGANSVVLPNVVIGRQAVVGAFSLVKEGSRLNSRCLYAGIPVRFIQ